MSGSHLPALDAIAFQTVVALERYEGDMARLVETWVDMELFSSVSDQIETIRLYSAALPRLSVPWAELLIAHAELVHCLWSRQFEPQEEAAERLQRCRAAHGHSVETLRSRCLRYGKPSASRPGGLN